MVFLDIGGLRDGLTATRLHFGDRCVGCCGWMSRVYLWSVSGVFAESLFFVVGL